jgi:putative DNA primase/helicase
MTTSEYYPDEDAMLLPPDDDYRPVLEDVDEDGEPRREVYLPTYEPGGRPLTDLGNAERFVDEHGTEVRYVPQMRSWLVWDGRRWSVDTTGAVLHLAKSTVRNIGRTPGTAEHGKPSVRTHANKSESADKMSSMVKVASSDPAVVVDASRLDPAHHLLGVANGVVDLRTKELRSAHQNDLMTKQAGTHYDPDAKCPKWLAFLDQVMLGDREMVSYLQVLFGYAATGSTAEHLMVVNVGGGRNGKGIAQGLVARALGEYAQTMPAASLMESRYGDSGSGPSSDIARMRGARYIQSSETSAGCKLAEAKVKSMTSSDVQVARFLNQEFFEYRPTGTIFLATNHRPSIKGSDKGIWSRLRIINWDFQVTEETMNKHLDSELEEELPGILAWVVEGAHRWYAEGMKTPVKVQQAVADYKVEMDTLGEFLDQECRIELGNDAVYESANSLYQRYRAWALNQGEKPMIQKTFGVQLTERGFDRKKLGLERRWHWLGLTLVTPWTGSEGF